MLMIYPSNPSPSTLPNSKIFFSIAFGSLNLLNQPCLTRRLRQRLFYAIHHTARGKTPGPDGLPAEYYQLFPSEWAQVLELVYAAQFRKGRMSKFQRRAYISLLFKKGSRSDPRNYRPLTLLNQDAKFGPKTLAYV